MSSITKYRKPIEWTNLVIKYVTKDDLTDTEKRMVIKILENCEMESKKEAHTEKDKMWRQLNKYWLYLLTLDEEDKI